MSVNTEFLSARSAADFQARRQRLALSAPLRRFLVVLACLFTCFAVLLVSSARAEDQLEVKKEQGFGRLVMRFDNLPAHSITTQNGIVVMSFDKPITMNVNDISSVLRDMVMAARRDPDGRALRLALSKKVKVNVIEAFDTLYVDLLPEPWTKPLPGLPTEAVAELNRKLEEAARKARDKAIKEEMKRHPASVNLRVGEHATFSRLAFDWSRKVGGSLQKDGDAYVLTFQHPTNIDLSRVKVEPPPQLMSIESTLDEYELRLRIMLQPNIEISTFEEGSSFIVDLIGEVADSQKSKEAEALKAKMEEESKEQQFIDTNNILAKNGGKVIRVEDPAAKEKAPISVVVPITNDLPGFAKLSSTETNLEESSVEADDGDQPASARNSLKDKQVNASQIQAESSVIQAEVKKVGNNNRIVFPFMRETSAAIFVRGQYVWLLFDSSIPIETRAIRTELKDLVDSIDHQRINTVQILRIQLRKPMLLSATSESTAWAITLGDSILTPSQPLIFERSNFADGRPYMRLPLQKTGQIYTFDDPVVGDKLTIITIPGPAQGMLRDHEFVEFASIATAHGIVLRTKADDVNIQVAENQAIISREMGLNISTDKGIINSLAGGGGRTSEAPRPGFIDFVGWKIDGPDAYFTRIRDLLNQAGMAKKGKDKTDRRLNVARFYLANEMAEEALGVLRVAKEDAPEIERDMSFRILRAVSSFYARRYKDAIEDLSLPELDKSPDVALWRGLSYAGMKEWRPAQLSLQQAVTVLSSYPPRLQVRSMLTLSRSSLEIRDVQQSEQILAQIDPRSLTPSTQLDKYVLDGWTADALGNTDLAEKYYQMAITPVNTQAEAEARLRLVGLMLNTGKLPAEDAIKELESLAMSWRGDEIELRTLSLLSRQLAQTGNFRRAFETMRTAVAADAKSDIVRLMQDDLQEVFVGLYLEDKDKNMRPMEALSLFYDYRELIPVGRRGDEVIRVLANKLVEVELLDQAIELLTYQVDKRLSGALKSEVASTLAMIHLMNRQPNEAITVLRRSRQAVLAQDLERRRLLLEVAALSELDQNDLALELLKGIAGNDIERMRADILWKAQKWQASAEAIERLLGKRWESPEPLNEQERIDILRAAVGYGQAGDGLGLQRFRGKFVTLMSNTPDAQAYNIITSSQDSQNFEFRSISRKLATTNSIEVFLKEYRQKYMRRPVVQEDKPAAQKPADPQATMPKEKDEKKNQPAG